MILKQGFLLVELMVGLTLSLFLILIIAHYIIEVKNIQQGVTARIEALSLARNVVEKIIAKNELNTQQTNDNKKFTVQITGAPFLLSRNNFLFDHKASQFDRYAITVSWNIRGMNHSLSLLTIAAHQEIEN